MDATQMSKQDREALDEARLFLRQQQGIRKGATVAQVHEMIKKSNKLNRPVQLSFTYEEVNDKSI